MTQRNKFSEFVETLKAIDCRINTWVMYRGRISDQLEEAYINNCSDDVINEYVKGVNEYSEDIKNLLRFYSISVELMNKAKQHDKAE